VKTEGLQKQKADPQISQIFAEYGFKG